MKQEEKYKIICILSIYYLSRTLLLKHYEHIATRRAVLHKIALFIKE